MFNKLIFNLFVLIFTCIANSFANPQDQIVGGDRTWFEEGYRYGMPGLANIITTNKDEHAYSVDVLPSGSNKLVIPLEHEITYGGTVYNHLTITSDNRIFLGNYEKYILPEDGTDGLYPYVKAINNDIGPVTNVNNVSVMWRMFEEHNDVFTTLEIGPFSVIGQADQLICQVSFYNDGEIQVQYWNKSRSKAYFSNNSIGVFAEKNYLNFPYMYTGEKRITLKDVSKNTVFHGSWLDVFSKGELREKWIAKAFEDDGPVFKVVGKRYYSDEQYLQVDFGNSDYSGGVLAYDYAREHPVIGSFQAVKIQASVLDKGNCSTSSRNQDIYFWYFDENLMYPNQSGLAGYPFLGESGNVSLNENVDASCQTSSNFYPCAYTNSWNKYLSRFPNGDLDTIKAPALKMQVRENACGKSIRIDYVGFRPIQPRAIQFRPPTTNKITYVGSVGYMNVGNVKAPLSLITNTNVNAEVHVTAGYAITQIKINNQVAFDENDASITQPGVVIAYDKSQNLAKINFNLICDVAIEVSYRLCTDRTITAVKPAYEKTEVFLDPNNSSKVIESYATKDGFGQIVQTQVPLGSNLYKVTALYLDDAGNTEYAPMPYVSQKKSYEYEDMACRQCVTKSAAYYNGNVTVSKEKIDSYGYPYSKTDYHYGENTALIETLAGKGQASFELGKNFTKTWKLPIATNNSSEFYSLAQLQDEVLAVSNGKGTELDNTYLNKFKYDDNHDMLDEEQTDYPFVLTINQSFDGIFTQSISDVAGNVHATWLAKDNEVLVNINKFDEITSQLTSSYIENHSSFNSTYVYDDAGRIIETESPDRGRKETKYDSKNRIIYTRDAKQIAKGDGFFNIFVYDDEDRIVETGEIRGDCPVCSFSVVNENIDEKYIHPITKTIYGLPSKSSILSGSDNVNENLLDNIINSMEGVSYVDVGAVMSFSQTGEMNSIKMSSYDRLGRVKKSWIINVREANMPAVEFAYEYTSSGEIKKTTFSEWNKSNNEWDVLTKYSNDYDDFGRVTKIYELDVNNNDNRKLMVYFERNEVGSVIKTHYYDKASSENDKNNLIYTKDAVNDIYGRTTKIVYADKNGKVIYQESLNYDRPLVNRVSGIVHELKTNSDKMITNESFTYDDLGRLTEFTTDMAQMKTSSYKYDIFGRLTSKSEGDTLVSYTYVDGSYRPTSLSLNGSSVLNGLVYDATGKVWLDGHQNVSYRLNAFGLPEYVTFFHPIPEEITLDDVDNDKFYEENENHHMEYAYDESGSRIWEAVNRRVLGRDYSRAIIPGVCTFKRERLGEYKIERIDLVNGGFRNGESGEAFFPITDAQGNIRGYANKTSLASAYAYYPFGETVAVMENSDADDRRWQSKEFDGEHGKYYFGARYFDPFLGLWMSPDPAGQFANPYTYGGDPVNYVDPTGMFAIGIGIVYSWSPSHGWGVGAGFAMDLDFTGDGMLGFNYSYSWNEDGSSSYNLGASAGVWLGAADFTLGLNFNHNSYTGSALTTRGGVCLGKKGVACAGFEGGYGFYWDAEGEFLGSTVHLEAYAEAAGGLARISGGYELGLFGMEGRGLYAGTNFAGLHTQLAQNGGASWGIDGAVYYGIGNNSNIAGADTYTTSVVRQELWFPTLGRFGHLTFGSSYDVSSKKLDDVEYNEIKKIIKNAGDEYSTLLKLVTDARSVQGFGVDLANQVNDFLLANGYERHDHVGQHENGSEKRTYRLKGSSSYGNLEIVVREDGTTYSSYNYGNNFLTHYFIDYRGWKGRGY